MSRSCNCGDQPNNIDSNCCCANLIADYVKTVGVITSALLEAYAVNPQVSANLVIVANNGIQNAFSETSIYLCIKCNIRLPVPTPFVIVPPSISG